MCLGPQSNKAAVGINNIVLMANFKFDGHAETVPRPDSVQSWSRISSPISLPHNQPGISARFMDIFSHVFQSISINFHSAFARFRSNTFMFHLKKVPLQRSEHFSFLD